MKRTIFLAALLSLLFAEPAPADAPPASIFSGRVKPDGYCQITNLTAAVQLVTASCSSGSVPSDANLVILIIEAQGIRYRTDGTNPTTTVGMPVPAGNSLSFALQDLTAIRMIAQTSGAIVNADFYK